MLNWLTCRNIGRTELLSKIGMECNLILIFFFSCAVEFLLGNQLTDSIAYNAHMTFTILNFSFFCSYSTRDYFLIFKRSMYVILGCCTCNLLPTLISHSFTTNDEKLMIKHWNRILWNDTFEEKKKTFHWAWDFFNCSCCFLFSREN